MRIPPGLGHYVPVSESELDVAMRIASQKHRQSFSRQALRACANEVGKQLFNGKRFPPTIHSVLLTLLPNTSPLRRRVYEDGIRVIFGRRHSYAVSHAHAHGHEPPRSPFRRVPKEYLREEHRELYAQG